MEALKNWFARTRERKLVKKLKNISVSREEVTQLIVDNPTSLTLLFCDKKSAVFRIDEARIVRIYRKEGKSEKEYQNLRLGAARGITPNALAWGPTYVVMEASEVTTLADHFQHHWVTKQLTQRILELLARLGASGFREDLSTSDIWLLSNGELRGVNTRAAVMAAENYPKKLLKSLSTQLYAFLDCVYQIDADIYEQWASDPNFHVFLTNHAKEQQTGSW